jgi:putative copper resistance protein D
VLLNVSTVLYPHYATLVRPWGPSPLEDQQLAAAIMWVTGDLIFIASLMALVAGWMRTEGRGLNRADREAAVDLAQIRVREQLLAERVARERGDAPG